MYRYTYILVSAFGTKDASCLTDGLKPTATVTVGVGCPNRSQSFS